MIRKLLNSVMLSVLCLLVTMDGLHAQSLPPETLPLELEGDIAAQLVDGVDRFLLGELEQSVGRRAAYWQRDLTSPEAYNRSIQSNRERLAHILGMRDARTPMNELEFVSSTKQSDLLAETSLYRVHAVRWPTVGGMHGEGLLLQPVGILKARAVVLPDADQTPEMLCGLQPGVAKASQIARRLAEAGCQVVVPTLVDRKLEKRGGRANLTSREFLYRSAYELGRHLIAYELHQTLAVVDWFEHCSKDEAVEIGVVGYGEGGMLALYAAALDPRITVCGISGCFAPRETLWQEPLDRNVFGLAEQFGAAELATMIAPRNLVVQSSNWPHVELPSEGGAPGRLSTPSEEVVKQEFDRAVALLSPAGAAVSFSQALRFHPNSGEPQFLFSEEATRDIAYQLDLITADALLSDDQPAVPAKSVNAGERQLRRQEEMDTFNQHLLSICEKERREFLNINLPSYDARDGKNKVDTSTVDAYSASIEPFREYFREEIIGRFDRPLLSANPRMRKTYDAPKWTGYEVTLDVFPGVFAYGILCIPKDLPVGEKRPVVVCQHGLEGRPQDIVIGDHPAYHDFASKLAERGFVTFSPQNLYIGQDRFRTLQRKAYLLKKTLFSIIVPQHQQVVNWLGSLPFVDKDRIGFYGLSYGGKSAMRIPPLVPGYCLSICSADFNDWVWKNASTQSTYSYVWTNEYEIFEFDLGSKFNYAEMAALIAPRPFMVERGHFDGVAPDDRVASEFAKVRHLYSPRLGIGDRCELEWFVGPHTIHGEGTFEFLHRHLQFPKRGN
jgi:dienelactone hydrolase